MQQVPYGIIGAGRMARHFTHYLTLLGIPFIQWSRGQSADALHRLIQGSERVLILIKDGAIEEFILSQPLLSAKTLIHFSGRLAASYAFGAHPLMTFGDRLYSLAVYQSICFIIDDNCPPFSALLPGLNNQHYTIPPAKKALYHSCCVLSGNFTVLLWQKFFKILSRELAIPPEAGQLYMQQIFHNLQNNYHQALTGPLVRNDHTTIAANINALAGDPYQQVYQAFVTAYTEENNHECS